MDDRAIRSPLRSAASSAGAALILLLLACPAFAASRKSASAFRILHSFRLLPAGPQAGLVADSQGNLYGTTGEGGDGDGGVVFRIRKDGSSFTVLHAFGITEGDGEAPVATLTLDSAAGTLYGTTVSGGGTAHGFGTVFRVGTDGSGYAILHRFAGGTSDGTQPNGPLVLDSGSLYGTTSYGGASGRGMVFRIRTDGTGFTSLHDFAGGGEGGNPKAGVVFDGSGNLFGTAPQAGASNGGTLFRMKTSGTGFTVIHSFAAAASDGYSPDTTLVRDASGNLYGTTSGGGPGGWGTVYRIRPDGTGFQVLHGFAQASPDGAIPAGSVALDGSGSLYGTTFFGGTDDHGVVFRVKTDGSAFTVLHRFAVHSDGAHPTGSLLLDGATIRATTFEGGGGGVGTLYSVGTNGSDFAVQHVFGVGILDGADPRAGLVFDADGTLYGTSCDGQPGGHGTVFRIAPDGSAFAILHGFPFDAPDGEDPSSPLVFDSAGNLCGTAYDGGTNARGTAFRLAPDGSGFRVLRGFAGFPGDGGFPSAPLLADASGNLYGTTSNGGIDDVGMVFRMKNDGSGFTVLRAFSGSPTDGAYPLAGLVADTSGNLYGTTEGGGAEGVGTVFRIRTNGTGFTVLHSFRDDPDDAEFPEAALVLDSAGYLYGTASLGGAAKAGAVFRVKTDGSHFEVVHSFGGSPDDGDDSRAPLALDPAGNLYGTTLSGGAGGHGIVFTLKTDGSGYRILHDFRDGPQDGARPYGGVVLDSSGNLYGTTSEGGAWFAGTVFELTPASGGVRVIPVTPGPAVPVSPRPGD